MPTPPNGNHLADKRYITVVLRLVVDERGRVTHGQLVDVASGRKQRFVGWRGLMRVVRGWLAQPVAPVEQGLRAHDRIQ